MSLRVGASVASNAAHQGLPRHPFTVADVERMVEAGILAEDDRVELIDGDLVTMSPKGIRHEILRYALARWWNRRLPERFGVLVETTLRLSETAYVEPDLLVFDHGSGLRALSGPGVLLAVEVSDTSLAYDLGRKPALYASHGVRELWVIDANRLETHVHRDPGDGRYASVVIHDAGALLAPVRAPDAALRLADLDLGELEDTP
jgi:Uma2 family endonuclease